MPPGMTVRSRFGSNVQPPKPMAKFGDPATFTAAANTQASDYDKIMSQYDDIAKNNNITADRSTAGQVGGINPVETPTPITYSPITPQLSQYEQSGDVTGSLSKLSDLATTGGYSAADIQDIRARDISPIRSIYANAQQNAERQRALGGGYSPNFNVVQAQMARDEANKIGDITTNANAGIAQNVASNKLSAAPSYASAAANANAAKTAANQRNTDIINQINQINENNRLRADEFNTSGRSRANEFNTSTAAAIAEANANRDTQNSQFNVQTGLNTALANRSGDLNALQGKTSLYGTTPGLTNMFGNQVIQAGQLGQGQQQINNQRRGQMLGRAAGTSSGWV